MTVSKEETCTCDQPRTQPVTVCPLHPYAWKRGKMQGTPVDEADLPESLRNRHMTPPNAPTAAERGRRCVECNWTNVGLLNIGEPGGRSRWICHGCIKRLIDEHESALLAARRENERAIEAWSRTEGERLKLEQEVRDLRTALDAARAAAHGEDR